MNERRSEEAMRRIKEPGTHLLSTLAFAESHAVIGRTEREGIYSPSQADEARNRITRLWQPLYATPALDSVEALSRQWPLRGADLWHLAVAKSLSATLPGLKIFTFDERLAAAAVGENLLA